MTALCVPVWILMSLLSCRVHVNMLKSTLLIACVDIYLLLLFTLKYNKELLMVHLNLCKLGGSRLLELRLNIHPCRI